MLFPIGRRSTGDAISIRILPGTGLQFYPKSMKVDAELTSTAFCGTIAVMTDTPLRRLPPWLKRRIGSGQVFQHTHHTLDTYGLETICTHANCPNRGDCWSRGTATVLILGDICTRNCKFCSVGHGKPLPPDATEPDRVAQMAKEMRLKYLVITSVDRDDLSDGGAGHFRDVVNRCRHVLPELKFELLVPDFRDCQDKAIDLLAAARPFVFGHNVETVPSLYAQARPGGDYARSLTLLRKAKAAWTARHSDQILADARPG